MPSLDHWLSEQLQLREKNGLLRRRTCIEQNHDNVLSTQDSHFLDFASNDYLGLRSHPDVLQAWVEGLAQYGGGSGASPLVTGYAKAHQDLEHAIAKSLNRDAALLFSSGFAANQAVCRALFSSRSSGTSATANGTIICDKFMHASFIDGAMASPAQLKRFKHNDMSHLEKLLAQADKNSPILVATEGVFSMDGDTPDIAKLVELCEQHGAWLMLDEAHALGVLGSEIGFQRCVYCGFTSVNRFFS
jgi:8-amino-7-oxononanoate synthase